MSGGNGLPGHAALFGAALALLGVALATAPAPPPARSQGEGRTPVVHRRGTEQTFLTYPEWFLVHSPAEYARFVRRGDPSDFPFLGHVAQFWQGYGAVYAATRGAYPLNVGYHVMILVIGTSTTVEYAIRSVYETLGGRLAELARTHGPTDEDRLAARVAQEYVDFIRVRPWYEFDFLARLRQLWTQPSAVGPDLVRKWERRYALTNEYGAKALYGWIIKAATRSAYDPALPVTAAVLDHLPPDLAACLPDLHVLDRADDGLVLVTLPRYEAFMVHAVALARGGVAFQEIAGNRTVILVSVLVPTAWQPDAPGARVLFTQPMLTEPYRKRVGVVVPVARLADTLRAFDRAPFEIEHVYDY